MSRTRASRKAWWWLPVAAAVCWGVYTLAAGQPPTASSTPPAQTSVTAASPTTPILVLLDTISVAPDGPGDGYSRTLFSLWSDPDHNGCDARNDTLRRDLADPVARDNTHNCVIIAGILNDPYTGQTVQFDKAHADQAPVDHIVPLALAWRHGASQWDQDTRMRFGNDPAELQITTRQANTSKGDSGPSRWLPPNPDYWCTYATRYVNILATWSLTVNQADKDTLNQVLQNC